MKLLVTGGAGFIGSNFIRYWMKNHPNDVIVNFDKLTYAGNLENLKDVEKNPHYVFIRGDVCDPVAVTEAMRGVDKVIHFAAESHVDRSIIDPAAFMLTNVVGTQVLLDAASRYKVQHFHYISTDEVFGDLGINDPPFHEKSPYHPRSPYSASKAGAGNLVYAYYITYGLPISISHGSNNYGPYQFPEKIIPLFVTNILEGKKVPLYGQGNNIRDWIYVDDFCRGIALIIEKSKIGQTYCLGGGHELNNLDLTHHILDFMAAGEECIERVPDRLGHDFRYALDTAKARRELGWEPLHSFEQGLKETIEWYKTHEEWWRRLKR